MITMAGRQRIRQAAGLSMLLAFTVLQIVPVALCSRKLSEYHSHPAGHHGSPHLQHVMDIHRRDFFHVSFNPSMVHYDNLKQCETLADTVRNCGHGGNCCSSVIRFWEIGCFCNAIIMAFNEKVEMLGSELATCGEQEQLDVAALEAHKCGQDIELVDAGDCKMTRFDLDKLRVSSILDMHKQWVMNRNLAEAMERSLGSKLVEEASYVFISERGVITNQQAARQIDPALLDDKVVQPTGTMAPTWFSARTYKNRVTFYAESSYGEHVYFGIQYQPCTDNINAILIEGIRPTGSAREEDESHGSSGNKAGLEPGVQAAGPAAGVVDPYGDVWIEEEYEDYDEEEAAEEVTNGNKPEDVEQEAEDPDADWLQSEYGVSVDQQIDEGLKDMLYTKAILATARRSLDEKTEPQGSGGSHGHPRLALRSKE